MCIWPATHPLTSPSSMYSPVPNLKTCLTYLCLKNFPRTLATTSRACNRNHYDSLGITPAATQAEVKSAYYKLSKTYHPDTSDGSEASSQRFREVSSAYEVLGNVKLRKMYDKGKGNRIGSRSEVWKRQVLGLINSQGQTYPEDPQMKFYRSREKRTRPPPPDGRTPIYDFDEWSRQHYGSTFAKDLHLKNRRRMRRMTEQYTERTNKNERFMFTFFALLVLFLYMAGRREDYDTVGSGDVMITVKKEWVRLFYIEKFVFSI